MADESDVGATANCAARGGNGPDSPVSAARRGRVRNCRQPTPDHGAPACSDEGGFARGTDALVVLRRGTASSRWRCSHWRLGGHPAGDRPRPAPANDHRARIRAFPKGIPEAARPMWSPDGWNRTRFDPRPHRQSCPACRSGFGTVMAGSFRLAWSARSHQSAWRLAARAGMRYNLAMVARRCRSFGAAAVPVWRSTTVRRSAPT